MNAMLHNTTTLDLSMSELSALVLRATKGAGFSWGEADEAADACVWLAQMGAECVGPLLDVLLDKTSCAPDINVAVWEGASVICPLRSGIILRDFVNLPKGLAGGSLVIKRVQNWYFLLPFISNSAVSLGQDIVMKAGADTFNLFADGSIDELPEIPSAHAANIEITITTKNVVHPPKVKLHRAKITLEQYEAISNLAMQMTVPTSNISEAGAGSSGSDND